MAQIYYRANLGDTDFPLLSEFQGRTVISPQLDQHYMQVPSLTGGEKDKGIPEAYYLHNVVPSLQGYKSVDYDPLNSPTVSLDFKRIFPIKDFDGNRGHIGVTTAGKTYIMTNTQTAWYDITPTGQPVGDVTVASATGTSFICYAGWGIFTINLALRTLTPAALQWDSPLTNADIIGIATSNNYLLAHDGTTLYWSSSLSVLDFRVSQITGAGNGVPTTAIGTLVAIAAVGIGFAVYCQGNTVVATFSGNVQYPWIFKEAPNGAGLESVDYLSLTGDDLSNYAWTTAGLLKVTLGGCIPVFPEVTDFLGGRVFEDFDTITDTFSNQNLSSPFMVRVAYLASRFLIVSYGVSSLTHALIYDSALKRWGKLKKPHVQAFDLSFKLATFQALTWEQLALHPWNDYKTTSWANLFPTGGGAIAPDAKHSACFLQADGSILRINTEYDSFAADAVLLLGKYQILRANWVTLQGFTVEAIDDYDYNFTVQVQTSYDGKTVGRTIIPRETISPRIRKYDCITTGSNHSILIKGAFHLVAAVLVFSKHGNR
jgi:hypothetical protein